MMKTFLTALTALLFGAMPLNLVQVNESYSKYNNSTNTIATSEITAQQDKVEAQAQLDKLPESINNKISDDATVVSSNYVMTEDGTLVDAKTGDTVTDKKIVGTSSSAPDPLARTGGEAFIPVSVEAAREAAETESDLSEEESASQIPWNESNNEQSDSESDDSQSSNQPSVYKQNTAHNESVGNWSSKYGAFWGTYSGQKAFFNRGGNLFAAPAKQVIDVSEWQGNIDWDSVKADGVEGAIIRIGYSTNSVDAKALRNLKEVQRVGIPFGVYLYSYASNNSEAWAEGSNVVRILKQAGITSSDAMGLPIYYDLENWSYAGHTHPTDPNVYDGIVNNFFMSVQLSGYGKVNVYSYTSYLNTALNTANIHSRTNWVATYGPTMQFNFQTSERGWQYTSSGAVNGISGNVDLNAFSFAGKVATPASFQVSSYPLADIADGEYHINSRVKDSSSVDIENASNSSGAKIQLYSYNHSQAQRFKFKRNANSSYTIVNSQSGKALDVYGATAQDKQIVWQYDVNGSAAQQWYIRDAGNGYVLQSALGNYVLDVANGSPSNGTSITLYHPEDTTAQRFIFASTASLPKKEKVSVRSAADTTKTWDVVNGSKSSSARIQVYSFNSSGAQNFTFKEVGNNVYEIVNNNSGKMLDVIGGSTANGAGVQQYQANGSQAQHWAIASGRNNQFVFVSMASGKALDLPNGAAQNGAMLQIYTANYSLAQKWEVRDFSESSNELADGDYIISPANAPGLALDVYGGNTYNGTNVWLYTYNGTAAQIWTVKRGQDGKYVLLNKKSGKALDIYNGAIAAGTNVDIYTQNQTVAQKWTLKNKGNGRYTVASSSNENVVLDVWNASFMSGTNVWVYTANGTTAQMWNFKRVR